MSFRALFGAPPAIGIVPTDQRIVCIDCDSDRPMFTMYNLHSFALRNGVVIEEVTGRRVCCQDCGAVFSIGPHGKFRQHKDAQPFTVAPRRATTPDDPQREPEEPRPPILPIPLRRPNV